jgi:hypothetical protein
MGRIEVITRTERRRKYSPAERAAIMREADAELAFAKQHNSPALVEKLRAAGYHPITNPHRDSLSL